jgi:methylmalonyl-CoA mutase C-terminal domain/subunit
MRRKRILIGKMGMDGHDVGMKVVAKVLQNNGFEVIYLGPYQSPDMIVKAAIQEAVDIIAIGSHSGEHEYFIPEMLKKLRVQSAEDTIKVVLAGLIPPQDISKFKDLGVEHIFPIATSLKQVEDYFTKDLLK